MTGNAKKSPSMVLSRMVGSWLRETEVMKRVTLYWHHSLSKEIRPSVPKEKLNESLSLTWVGSPSTAKI